MENLLKYKIDKHNTVEFKIKLCKSIDNMLRVM